MANDPTAGGLIPATIQKYYVVFLHKGPQWSLPQTPEETELHHRHLAFNKALYEAGKILAYGPTLDPTNEDLRGMSVIKASSAEEARELLEQDPRYLAGHFRYVVVPWMADSLAWRER